MFFKVQALRDLGSAVTIKDECVLFSSTVCAGFGVSGYNQRRVYAFFKCRLCVIWGQRLQLKTSVCFFQVHAVRDLGSAAAIKDECMLFSSAGCA